MVEFFDSYSKKVRSDGRKTKTKTDKPTTRKKPGPKPKTQQDVVAESTPPKETGAEQMAEDNVEQVDSSESENKSSETVPVTEPKKRGRKPKAQPVEEAPKKHRGRPRKTAEAFEEEKVETYSEADLKAEEQAAEKAASIPTEGDSEFAQIDFGL